MAVHAGQFRNDGQLSRGIPIYRTASYLFKDTEHSAALIFNQSAGEYLYTDHEPDTGYSGGPGCHHGRCRAALALASGTSAVFYSIINLARAGDEIVAASNLYGGIFTMLNDILPQFGIHTRMVTVNGFEGLALAINKKT